MVLGDPCQTGNYQEFQTAQFGSRNEFCPPTSDLCDYYIEEQWYRASLGVFLDHCPTNGSCGATYPIWIKG